jgi:hypothetical protein
VSGRPVAAADARSVRPLRGDRVEHPADPFALRLGRLLNSFQSLEFAIRAFLFNHRHDQAFHSDFNLRALEQTPIGDWVPVNALTDYKTLEKLITTFNSHHRAVALGVAVDASVVAIRDALAHGRVYSHRGGDPMRLLKFGREIGGKVPVEFSEELSMEWLDKQVQRVQTEMHRVLSANEAA